MFCLETMHSPQSRKLANVPPGPGRGQPAEMGPAIQSAYALPLPGQPLHIAAGRASNPMCNPLFFNKNIKNSFYFLTKQRVAHRVAGSPGGNVQNWVHS